MNKKDMIKILKENYEKLTGSQKKICRYILDHYEMVTFMSAVELSEVMGVSDVTIIRFVRNLGFSGYVEFKKYMREGLKNSKTPDERVSKMMEEPVNLHDFAGQIYRKDAENLAEFMAHLDVEMIDTVVEEIYKARRIYLFGMGTTIVVSDFLLTHLRRMGFDVVFVCEGGADNSEKLLSITKGDVLFTTCFPRYSRSSYTAILHAKEKGAKCITLTDNSSSLISIHSDIVVQLKVENVTFFNSYIVPLEFCNILITYILEKDKQNVHQRLKENIRVMEKFSVRM